jgi:hypothetical protein
MTARRDVRSHRRADRESSEVHPEWVQNVLDNVVLVAPTRYFFYNGSEQQVAEVGIAASAAGSRSETRETLEVLGNELVRVVPLGVLGMHPAKHLEPELRKPGAVVQEMTQTYRSSLVATERGLKKRQVLADFVLYVELSSLVKLKDGHRRQNLRERPPPIDRLGCRLDTCGAVGEAERALIDDLVIFHDGHREAGRVLRGDETFEEGGELVGARDMGGGFESTGRKCEKRDADE